MNNTIVKTDNDFEVINNVTNPSEFERVKPVITYKKINNVVKLVDKLFAVHPTITIEMINNLKIEVESMRNSFLKGE